MIDCFFFFDKNSSLSERGGFVLYDCFWGGLFEMGFTNDLKFF